MSGRPEKQHDPAASGKPLDLESARTAILQDITGLPDVESLQVSESLGRVLAEPLVSEIDVPDFDNSAMDGYALRSADQLPEGSTELAVSQHIRAGDRPGPLRAGTAARIFTGAPLPAGADTIIMQEECEAADGRIRLNRRARAGEHVRRRAHDIARGGTVLPAGRRIRPQDIAIAAACGTMHLTVRRRPRVAVFSTGNELALPGQALQPGHRYTANNHLLGALARRVGAEVTDAGIVPDDLDVTCGTLTHLSREHDLILSSGGASVGDEDHVRRALERVGSMGLWRVALRPGKPVISGRLDNGVSFLGLPGNPVSVFVTFLLLVRPLVLALQGASNLSTTRLRVRAGFDWPEPGSRREFVRVRVEPAADGEPVATIYPDQSSDVLSSVVWADGLADIPAGVTLAKGDGVGYLPFSGLID
jgi:molybdopterin molybdotransferase